MWRVVALTAGTVVNVAQAQTGPTPPATVTANQVGVADYYGCPQNPDSYCGVKNISVSTSTPTSAPDVSLAQTYGPASFYGEVTGGWSPSATVHVTATSASGASSDRWWATGSASTAYQYQVVDPYGSENVPLVFDYTMNFTVNNSGAGPSYQGFIYLLLGGDTGYEISDPSSSALGTHKDMVSVRSGNWNLVSLQVSAVAAANNGWVMATGTGNFGAGTADVTVSIDPTLSIDPTWLSTHPGAYISYDFGAVAPAVPEPSTLGLLIGGLAVIGYQIKRQRPINSTACRT